MAVYVDSEKIPFRGLRMCHMFADTADELYKMADKIGVDRKHFQASETPHFDICQSKRRLALQHGAKSIDRRKVVELINQHRRNPKEFYKNPNTGQDAAGRVRKVIKKKASSEIDRSTATRGAE